MEKRLWNVIIHSDFKQGNTITSLKNAVMVMSEINVYVSYVSDKRASDRFLRDTLKCPS